MAKLKSISSEQKVLSTVLLPFSATGWSTISGDTCRFTAVQKEANNGRPFSNLYPSFNLPTTCAQTQSYLSTWAKSGMSAITQDNVIVMDIATNQYGELIDGRTLKLVLPVSSSTSSDGHTTLYSSYYEPKPFSSDNSSEAEYFGNPILRGNVVGTPGLPSSNVAFLFADSIKTPVVATTNTNITSWADGWQSGVTPNGYDGGGVDNFRFSDTISSSNTPKAYALPEDIPVGVAYLDKGFVVITDQTLVNNFLSSGGTEDGSTNYGITGTSSGFTQLYYTGGTQFSGIGCTYYSFEKEWVMSINIIAGANEFYITENQTASSAEQPYYGAGGVETGIQYRTPFGDVNQVWDLSDVSSSYITKVGLYDNQDKLLAVAIPNSPIKKLKNSQVNLTLKLNF